MFFSHTGGGLGRAGRQVRPLFVVASLWPDLCFPTHPPSLQGYIKIINVMFLSDEGPMLETLDHTIRIGSTPTFLY